MFSLVIFHIFRLKLKVECRSVCRQPQLLGRINQENHNVKTCLDYMLSDYKASLGNSKKRGGEYLKAGNVVSARKPGWQTQVLWELLQPRAVKIPAYLGVVPYSISALLSATGFSFCSPFV